MRTSDGRRVVHVGASVATSHLGGRLLDTTEDHGHAAQVFSDTIAVYRTLPGDEALEELAGVLVNAAVCASARADHDAALEFVSSP
jgi:hypothetical protein